MWKSIEEAVEKMLKCGSYENGYALYQCAHCGEGYVKVGFTCKSRFCARCGRIYVDKWVAGVTSKLANVKHWHVVFTIPKEFRGFFFKNRKLLKKLADLAAETVSAVIGEQRKKKGLLGKVILGIIAVIHTFGRDLKYNPHIHMLVACGGVNKRSKKWEDIEFLLYEGLHKVWQYKLLNFIKAQSKGDAAIARLVDQCWKSKSEGLYVNVQKPMKNAKHAARYIGRYLARPAIAEYRIEEYDGKTVTFWYQDHKSGQQERCKLPVEEFIGRLVMHIAPKHFQMVRRYGFYGRRVSELVKNVVQSLKKFVQQVFEEFQKGKRGWRERLIEAFNRDPLKCPNCGGEMELWEIWHPKYGKIYDIWEGASNVSPKKTETTTPRASPKDCQARFAFM